MQYIYIASIYTPDTRAAAAGGLVIDFVERREGAEQQQALRPLARPGPTSGERKRGRAERELWWGRPVLSLWRKRRYIQSGNFGGERRSTRKDDDDDDGGFRRRE